MGTETMRGHLLECRLAYAKAGPLVRSQVAPFMAPLLELLEQVLCTLENQRRAEVMDGLKAQSCNSGGNSTCAGRGCPMAAEKAAESSIQEGAPVNGWATGSPQRSAGHGFPPIEG